MSRTVLEKFHTIFSPHNQTLNNWYSLRTLTFSQLYAVLYAILYTLYSLRAYTLALPFDAVWLAYTQLVLRVSSTLSSTLLLLCAIQLLLELDLQLFSIVISINMLTFMFISSIVLFYVLLYTWIVLQLSLHVWSKP